MGKISDALQKVMQERERQKRQSATPLPAGQPQATSVSRRLLDDKPLPSVKQAGAAEQKKQPPLTASEKLRDKVKTTKVTLEERLRQKERTYLVRATKNSGIDARIVTYHDYFSPLSEQYRTLRTNVKSYLKKAQVKLKMTRPVAGTRIIGVSSSVQGEGKSVTAANLAVALAHDLENKVLLVDCDLRKGSVDALLHIDRAPGLSELLNDGLSLSEVVRETNIQNLFVVPSGDAPSIPSELFGSKKMKALLESLKAEGYNYVILDTPPLIPFTDASVLGTLTDGMILVVQSRRTQAHMVKKMTEHLEQAHVPILGFVLTSTEYPTSEFYSNYYYYHTHKEEEQ